MCIYPADWWSPGDGGLELLDNLFADCGGDRGGCRRQVIKSDYSVLGSTFDHRSAVGFRHNDVGSAGVRRGIHHCENEYYCVSALAYVPLAMYNGGQRHQEFQYLFTQIYPVIFWRFICLRWITGRVGSLENDFDTRALRRRVLTATIPGTLLESLSGAVSGP